MISSRMSTGLAVALCLLSLILAIAAAIVTIVLQADSSYDASVSTFDLLVQLFMALTFALVGGLIAVKRAGNLIGWALFVAGIGLIAEALLLGYAELALLAKPEAGLPAGMIAAVIGSGVWTLLMAAIFLLLLTFPSGKVPSRRWRVVTRIVLLSFAIVWIAVATYPVPEQPFEDFENPLAFSSNEAYLDFGYLLVVLCLVGVAGAAIDLLIRFWRSSGDEREQYKWLAFAACFLIVTLPFALVEDFNGIAGILISVALIALPASVGIAVLRYRLYEIDVIINRTLVYVPLTAILAGLYVAMTGLSRTVFTELSGTGSDAAKAISTLAVVALLTPLKNQLQALVDRYFKEQRDPLGNWRRLTGQAESVVQVLDTQDFLANSLRELVDGLDASGATIEIGNGADQRSLSHGQPSELLPVTRLLVYRGEQIGTLKIWPRSTSKVGETAIDEEATRAAALLVKVIALAPGQNLDRAGAEMVEKAAVR